MKPVFNKTTSKKLDYFINTPSHALSLFGEKGAGKGMAAAYVGSRILNIGMDKLSGAPYVSIIDAQEAKIGIDSIRELKKFMSLSIPGQSRVKRLVIIENLDFISHAAQNALLKTIEEPPLDTLIILTYAASTAVLPTIHSRVQSVPILPLSIDEALEHYRDDFPPTEIKKYFHLSRGKAGLLHALLNQDADHPLYIAINRGRELLKKNRYERLASVYSAIKSKDISSDMLLEALYCLIEANYTASLAAGSADTIRLNAKRLQYVYDALIDLGENVQAKLVFGRLFLQI